MENLEIIFESLRKVASTFVWNGIFAIICGLLVFIYPDLLGMLVGVFLVLLGITSLAAAVKIRKYSKISLKV